MLNTYIGEIDMENFILKPYEIKTIRLKMPFKE